MKADDNFDFGEGLRELEAITAWFESENIDLDEGLVKFERGMELAGKLRARLATTQNHINKIKDKFDQPSAKPVPSEPDDNGLPF